jgi:hypothetical protein
LNGEVKERERVCEREKERERKTEREIERERERDRERQKEREREREKERERGREREGERERETEIEIEKKEREMERDRKRERESEKSRPASGLHQPACNDRHFTKRLNIRLYSLKLICLVIFHRLCFCCFFQTIFQIRQLIPIPTDFKMSIPMSSKLDRLSLFCFGMLTGWRSSSPLYWFFC